MANDYFISLPTGDRVTFKNPDGFYVVNPYQSELLAQVAVQQAFVLATREVGGTLDKLSAVEWCAGNGPAAISLKKIGIGYVEASDINADSLENTRRNSVLNGIVLEDIRIRDVEKTGKPERKFDLIAVNPPCGPDTVVPEAASEALRIAVNGGRGGIHYFNEAVRASRDHLKENGRLAIVLTSTMDVVEGVKTLNAEYGHRWFAAPTTPIIAPSPGISADDTRGKTLLAAADQEQPHTIAYRDGNEVKRLSWIIIAENGKTGNPLPFEQQLPLRPYGQPFTPENDRLTAAAEKLKKTFAAYGLGTP